MPAPAAQSSKPILEYPPGPLSVGGAVTIEIVMPPVPLQPLIDAQYIDSKTMSQRPGMYTKYFPYMYSPVNGKMLGGGCYAFDTYENAKEYVRWTEEEYQVEREGKMVKFWDQALFEKSRKWVWRVIGAHSFCNIEAHSSLRLIQWKYTGDKIEKKLAALYPKLKETVENMGVAAVWLLHNPEEKMVGLNVAFKNENGAAGEDFGQKALRDGVKKPLETLLPPELGLEEFYDRTSLLLTLWLPRSREAGGTELHIPLLSTIVPDISLEYI